MKKMKIILIGMLILCLMVFAAGCSEEANASNDPAKFAEENSGTWYRYGNTQDDKLIIFDDGTWEHYEEAETISAEGIIEYNEEYKSLDFLNEKDGTFFWSSIHEDGGLEFGYYRYFPEENSKDGFDEYFGKWYVDGDTSKEYFMISTPEGGTVRWLSSVPLDESGQSVEQRSGDLIWNGIKNVFIADGYSDEDFAVFTIKDTGVLSSGGKDYILVKDDEYYEDGFETEDDYDSSSSQEIDIIGEEFYYLNGDSELESLYFFTIDNTVDLDIPGQDTIEGAYSISGNTLTVTVGETEFHYEISDDGTKLVDEYGDEYLCNEWMR